MGYDYIPPGMRVEGTKLVAIVESQATRDELYALLNQARAEKDFWQAEAARLEAVRVSILDAGVPGYVRKDRLALETQIRALELEVKRLSEKPAEPEPEPEEEAPKRKR
jgi:cob(I)alamin adenosyltransferase